MWSWCYVNPRRWRFSSLVQTHHPDEQFLTLLAVIDGAAEEVEESRPIKIDNSLSIVKGRDGFVCVAMKVIPFLHHQD